MEPAHLYPVCVVLLPDVVGLAGLGLPAGSPTRPFSLLQSPRGTPSGRTFTEASGGLLFLGAG